MITFTTYKQTGEIIGSGHCQDDMLAAQSNAAQGVFVLPVTADFRTQYVQGGLVLDLPIRPSKNHRFNYTTKEWWDPRTVSDKWAQVRVVREPLLQATDWTQLQDIPTATRVAYVEYRQDLRNLTLQADPDHIIWPVLPA